MPPIRSVSKQPKHHFAKIAKKREVRLAGKGVSWANATLILSEEDRLRRHSQSDHRYGDEPATFAVHTE